MVAIPGTKRVRWLEENAAARELALDKADFVALDAIAGSTVGARYNEHNMEMVDR